MLKYHHIVNNEGSIFYYFPNFLETKDYNSIKNYIENKNYHSGSHISGKDIPRKQLWFQENGEYFCKKWINKYERWNSNIYENKLKDIQDKIQIFTNNFIDSLGNEVDTNIYNIQKPNINSCLINKYRNGNDSIKPHRDTPNSFGLYPTIIGLSIGETRNMIIKKIKYNDINFESLKIDKDNSEMNLDIELEDNSLFIMAGASQKYFTHEIPKSHRKGCRYSLTFREYIY